jgi:hypothetical protein
VICTQADDYTRHHSFHLCVVNVIVCVVEYVIYVRIIIFIYVQAYYLSHLQYSTQLSHFGKM